MVKSNLAFRRYSFLFSARKLQERFFALHDHFICCKKHIFLCGRIKEFLLFFAKMICAIGKKGYLRFSGFARIKNRSKHSWKEGKCGQFICLSHESFCGKNKKKHWCSWQERFFATTHIHTHTNLLGT